MSDAAKLASGYYIISNLSDKAYVGRNPVEDRSLNPKKVVSLPEGLLAPQWIIEALPNGRYRLKINGAPTGPLNNLVFAFLLDEKGPEEWVITPVPQNGKNVYTIETQSRYEGWVLPNDEPYTQVACRKLVVGRSIPPYHSPTQLWTINPISID